MSWAFQQVPSLYIFFKKAFYISDSFGTILILLTFVAEPFLKFAKLIAHPMLNAQFDIL